MSGFSVKKPLTIFVAAIAIVILGVVAYMKMTPDLMPNMNFPYVIIVTTYPGASPESVEEEVTKPLESSMATLNDIKSVTSSSSDNYSMVLLEFEESANLDSLGVDIQQKISTLQGSWSDTIGTPYVLKINPSMLPVMVAGVAASDMDINELSDFMDSTMTAKLEGITGVAQIDVSGTVSREMHVILDQDKMNDVSDKLYASVKKQLDSAWNQLVSAKKQITDAQDQITEAKNEAVNGVVSEVGSALASASTALNSSLNAITNSEYAKLSQLTTEYESLKAEKNALGVATATDITTARVQEIDTRMTEIETTLKGMGYNTVADAQKAMQTQQQKAQDTAKIYTVSEMITSYDTQKAETEKLKTAYEQAQKTGNALDIERARVSYETANVQLQAAESGIKAMGYKDVEEARADVKKHTESVNTVSSLFGGTNTDIPDLSEPGERAKFEQSLASGLTGILDAVMMLTETDIQLNSALAQIESGFDSINEYRDSLKDQLNVSSMLSISTLSQLLTAQNFAMPAGYIDDNDGISYMVSVGDSIQTYDDLNNLVLLNLGLDDIDSIRLCDVAQVFEMNNSDDIYTKLNGENGIVLSFTKQSTYATAEVSKNITARFKELESTYDNIKFYPLMDQGDYIYVIVDSILSSLLWGALFSVVVLFIFLRDWRPTVITLVSIPLSVVFAVVLMYFSGVTINMISLSGLAVSVGMLVDNSVVVIENIYRLRDKGATIIQAAVSGAGQVVGAVTSSTLTTVCVFLPIVFVEGITKQLFTDLALTMSYSLIASLLVALTLVPAMATGLLRRPKEHKDGLMDKVYPVYRKALNWSLDHKVVVLGAAAAMLVLSGIVSLSRGFIFMPEMDANMISATITMPEDASREHCIELADEVGQKALTIDNIEAVGAMMGSSSIMSSGSSDSAYDVTLYITLPDGCSGIAAGKELEKLCEGMECEVSSSSMMSSMLSYLTGSGVSLKLYSNDMEDLQQAAKDIAKVIGEIDGISEVSDGLDDATEALHISVDRVKAMEHGMTVAQVYMKVAAALTNKSSGTQMTLDDQKMDMVFESPKDSRVTVETLEDLKIENDSSMSASSMSGMSGSSSMSGMSSSSALSSLSGSTSTEKEEEKDTSFRLGDVATVEKTVSMNTISRDQQRRCLTVSAVVSEDSNVTLVTSDAVNAVKNVKLPSSVSYEFNGENEQIMEAMKQLVLLLLLGMVLVYFVMVAQFQSLKSPFIVMFTIPLAFTGGFLALLIAGFEVSVISMIGFVMLVGIIVNNGIVLVDYINQNRMAGMERREAIIDAGVTRMRPILMTSLTTILGDAVMAMSNKMGMDLMRPVALVCIGGLLYATLMTLFIVPCIYDMMNKKELRKIDESELVILED